MLVPGDPAGAPPPARFGRRIAAGVIDLAIALGVAFLAIRIWGSDAVGGIHLLGCRQGCVVMLWIPSYWIVTECLFAATLGKALFDLRVYSLVGGDPDFLQLFKRSIAKTIDTLILPPLGLVIALTNPLRQAGHDMWTKTMVVEEKALARWKAGDRFVGPGPEGV